jgi:hypothetical protein
MSKIKGKHTTVIGGRKGLDILLRIASSKHIKKIIPGRVEGRSRKIGRGIRARITRVDKRGNIKMIISTGPSAQEIYLITYASNREEGLEIADEIKKLL